MQTITGYLNKQVRLAAHNAQEGYSIAKEKAKHIKRLKKKRNDEELQETKSFIHTFEAPFTKTAQQQLKRFLDERTRLSSMVNEFQAPAYEQTTRALKEIQPLLERLITQQEAQQEAQDTPTLLAAYEEEEKLLNIINTQLKKAIKTGEQEKDKALAKTYRKAGKKKGLKILPLMIMLALADLNSRAYTTYEKENRQGARIDLSEKPIMPKMMGKHVHFATHIPKSEIGNTKETKEGAATIYAQFFDGKETASGREFHHNEASCAVPIGSKHFAGYKKKPNKVRITNMENGKSIITQITDLGNFGYNDEKGTYNKYKDLNYQKGKKSIKLERIIDLSKKAAYELGIITEEQLESKEDLHVSQHIKTEFLN